jgi:hypothetical protein
MRKLSMVLKHPNLCAALRTVILACGGCLPLLAWAHDTWFEALPATATAAGIELALGTGNQFPVMESPLVASSLVNSGCTSSAGERLPLPAQRSTPQALRLLAPAQARTCWAQSEAFEVTIGAELVAVYFKEIQASAAVRAGWAQLQQRGLPWRERYVKHARIELGDLAPTPSTTPMAMDLQLQADELPVRAGSRLNVLVLRDGQPLADQAIELRGDSSKLGIWRRSDAQGRLQFTLPRVPEAGRWVLRGTDVRVSTERPDTWDSRFITLAFDVKPAAQKGSSLNSNARSMNQASASAAINSEPASNTTRR